MLETSRRNCSSIGSAPRATRSARRVISMPGENLNPEGPRAARAAAAEFRSGPGSAERRLGVLGGGNRELVPVHIHLGREVARQPGDQPQAIVGEAQRQLVQRELGLVLDLRELGKNLAFALHVLVVR